jgi:hypothetical protein
MKDRQLDDLLGGLARERAGEGFTAGVLERLEEGRGSRGPLRLVLGLVVFVALAASAAVLVWQQAAKQDLRQQIALLRREARQLRADLEALRARTAEERPKIYLGGDDRVDYVLDMKRFMQAQRRSLKQRLKPASYPGGSI